MDEIRAMLPVSEVTLFEDRAKVKRSGFVELPTGISRVRIPGVSPIISDRTLNAIITDEDKIAVGSLMVRRFLKSREDLAEEISGIEKEIEQKKSVADDLSDQLNVVRNAVESRMRILELSSEEIPADIAAGRNIDEKKSNHWEKMDEGRISLALDEYDLETEIFDLNSAINDLEVLLNAKRTPSTRCDASIQADIRTEAAGRYSLEIEYVVPGACWRPRHRAVMNGDIVRFETDGCIWQNTGEDWKNVSLSFSTHRPSLGTRAPILGDDRISVVKKAKDEEVEIREESVENTGFGGESPGSVGSQRLPGVEDGGTVRTFRASDPADIPSDGRPYRVHIGSFESPSTTGIIVLPELSPYAVIRSIQTNSAVYPVLAGPVDLIKESGYVGRTSVMYMAPGEKFALGWGPDPDIRVYRNESTRTREAGGLSSWDRTEYTVDIRLSNIGSELKTLTVRERIPVSELERVRVKFDAEATAKGCGEPDADGMLEWPLSLGASDRTNLKLVYTMETHKKVVSV